MTPSPSRPSIFTKTELRSWRTPIHAWSPCQCPSLLRACFRQPDVFFLSASNSWKTFWQCCRLLLLFLSHARLTHLDIFVCLVAASPFKKCRPKVDPEKTIDEEDEKLGALEAKLADSMRAQQDPESAAMLVPVSACVALDRQPQWRKAHLQ